MSDSGTTDHTTRLTRIREVAMTVREPNAGKIAEAAGGAQNTAETYLTQLVETDELTTVQRGRETCYYPDSVIQYFEQIRDRISEHQKDELTAELAAIREDIHEWKQTYDGASADERRTTVGDDIPASERQQRRHDAEGWEYYEHRALLIKQAIQLYDAIEATRGRRLASGAVHPTQKPHAGQLGDHISCRGDTEKSSDTR